MNITVASAWIGDQRFSVSFGQYPAGVSIDTNPELLDRRRDILKELGTSASVAGEQVSNIKLGRRWIIVKSPREVTVVQLAINEGYLIEAMYSGPTDSEIQPNVKTFFASMSERDRPK